MADARRDRRLPAASACSTARRRARRVPRHAERRLPASPLRSRASGYAWSPGWTRPSTVRPITRWFRRGRARSLMFVMWRLKYLKIRSRPRSGGVSCREIRLGSVGRSPLISTSVPVMLEGRYIRTVVPATAAISRLRSAAEGCALFGVVPGGDRSVRAGCRATAGACRADLFALAPNAHGNSGAIQPGLAASLREGPASGPLRILSEAKPSLGRGPAA